MVSVGPFEYVIATEQNVGTIERIGLEAHDDDSLVPSRYELVLIGEQDDGTMEYHVYEGNGTWIAEAHVRLDGTEASGEISWRSHYPDREEIDAVADLLTSDFDEDENETFFSTSNTVTNRSNRSSS